MYVYISKESACVYNYIIYLSIYLKYALSPLSTLLKSSALQKS